MKNAHTASFLATCILRLIKWTYLVNDKLKNILTELRSHFEQIYDTRLVTMVLYGSQARGDARPDSDIDVLVVLKGQVNPGEEIKKTSHIRADLSLPNDEVLSKKPGFSPHLK
ncbi:MAG: nucleotidyltransferase domain-containing protein [Microcoleus sp.]